MRATCERPNLDHTKAMRGAGDRTFAKKEGIFTHVYNSAHRFGESKAFKV